MPSLRGPESRIRIPGPRRLFLMETCPTHAEGHAACPIPFINCKPRDLRPHNKAPDRPRSRRQRGISEMLHLSCPRPLILSGSARSCGGRLALHSLFSARPAGASARRPYLMETIRTRKPKGRCTLDLTRVALEPVVRRPGTARTSRPSVGTFPRAPRRVSQARIAAHPEGAKSRSRGTARMGPLRP